MPSQELINSFTTHLKEALTRALCFVVENHESEVCPKHLLWAISTQKGCVGSELLKKVQIKSSMLESWIHEKKRSNSKKKTRTPFIAPPLSKEAKQLLEKAVLTAHLYTHRYIGTEHLLSGMLQIKDPVIENFFKKNKIDQEKLIYYTDALLKQTSGFPEKMDGEIFEPLEEEKPNTFFPNKKSSPSILETFGRDLTSPEIQKNIDPVIGRKEELLRTMEILCRRTKNNPLLIGEPGVGKTALVEGLAKQIVEGSVPPMLAHKRIIALDLPLLVAGAIYRGEFESRLKQIIEEARLHPEIVLFIDEIHTIIGAGATSGSLDAAHILKPPLARGEIHCIGATTPQEFKKYIEQDSALERRLQPIYLKEPSKEETFSILKGIVSYYEHYHRVHIQEEALKAAVQWSDRYLQEKRFPDKAIDLIDEAAASVRVRSRLVPTKEEKMYHESLKKLETIAQAKEQAILEERFSDALDLKEEEAKARKYIEEVRDKVPLSAQPKLSLTKKDIAKLIARMKQIPLSHLLQDIDNSLVHLEKHLNNHIQGQKQVIKLVTDTIRKTRVGLSKKTSPTSFLFVGSSGVGKTELAKTLAKFLYPNEQALIRFNMSEFSESFSVSKLIGAPAGYIGYREQAQLTDQLKHRSHGILLFDEMEKAHEDVQNLLLHILEEGVLTDATGSKIHLRDFMIIFTSNIDASFFTQSSLGFKETVSNSGTKLSSLNQTVREELETYFLPELLNRLDAVCLFEPLQNSSLKQIATRQIKMLQKRLEEKQIVLTYDHSVIEYLARSCMESPLAVREIHRNIEMVIEPLFLKYLLVKKSSACSLHLQRTEELFVLTPVYVKDDDHSSETTR